MLKLDFKKSALKFFDNIPAKQFRQIFKKLLLLLKDPHPADSIQLKGDPAYRVDVGEYRIIYEVKKDVLYVFAVGKRNDSEVYRRYLRK